MAKDWKDYERTIAKELGIWWGCVFRRTPSSGAWGKQGQSRNSYGHDAAADFHGDIVAPPEAKFPFSVECKCYKEVDLYLALYGAPIIPDWWEQCLADAQRATKWPMLIMKENYKKPLIVISGKLWDRISSFIKQPQELRVIQFEFVTQGVQRRVVIMNFMSFLAHCPPRLLGQR